MNYDKDLVVILAPALSSARSVSLSVVAPERRSESGAWPDDLDLDAAPTLIRELASRGLWLEQELIAVDPRLRAALEATGEG